MFFESLGFIPSSQKIGEIADFKEISEAIIAIPFVDNNASSEEAETVKIIGKNFFKISRDLFDFQKQQIDNAKSAIPGNSIFGDIEKQSTSISDLYEKMKKYVIPPELDFLTYSDIEPFVMYIFEFKHMLDRQDLADIWQGVMPKISMTAEKDLAEIIHTFEKWEFFEGKKLPKNIRWMVFKAKKKASINYYELTADSKDDNRFRFDFEIGEKAPEYSYNWPYDFF